MPKGYINVSERKVVLRLFDALIIAGIFFVSDYIPYFEYISMDDEKFIVEMLTLIIYFNVFGQIFQLYSLNVASSRYKIVQSLFLTSSVTTLFYVFTPILSPLLPEDRIQILFFYSLLFFTVLIWRFAYTILLFSPKYFKDIIVIAHSTGLHKLHKLVHNDYYHNVVAYVSDANPDKIDRFFDVEKTDLRSLVSEYSVTELVFDSAGFSNEMTDKLRNDLIHLFEEGVSIKSYETFYEEHTLSIPQEYLNNNFYQSIPLSKNNDSRFYSFFHRTWDVIISVVGIVVFIVFLPLIVIFNLIGNRGPLIYTQNRVGAKGKVFTIYKLRTMIPNAEKDGIQFTVKNDKRITAFGRFLRVTRLDEMPQFINILKGDMSIIGPRPERP